MTNTTLASKRWLVAAFLMASVIASSVLVSNVRAATMTAKPASVTAKAGETVDVPLQVTNAPGISAMHLEVVYDSSVLMPETVLRGSLAGSDALFDFNATNSGRILIGLATLSTIKGDGPIASVRFKVVGKAGSTSPLTLEKSAAWESGTHAEVLVRADSGTVTVKGKNSSLLWIIILVIVLIALLILFFLVRKRRKSPAGGKA